MKRRKIYTIITIMFLLVSQVTYAESQSFKQTVTLVLPATIVSATVPLVIPCAINPNEKHDKAFVAPTYKIQNTSKAPIQAKVQLKPTAESNINLVEPTKFPKWNNLTTEESRNIAIGIEDKGWFKLSEDIELDPMKVGEMKEYNFMAKHGMAFRDGNSRFDFKLVVKIELVE